MKDIKDIEVASIGDNYRFSSEEWKGKEKFSLKFYSQDNKYLDWVCDFNGVKFSEQRNLNSNGSFWIAGAIPEEAKKLEITVDGKVYSMEFKGKVNIDDIDGYYDLIELPSGGHIPVPIAAKLIGWNEFEEVVAKIPKSSKVRDEQFFTCPICGYKSFFSQRGGCNDCRRIMREKFPPDYSEEELECIEYNEEIEEKIRSRMKEIEFLEIIRKGDFKKMEYISSAKY